MNSLTILAGSAVVFLIAYRFYGKFIAGLWKIDIHRQPPSIVKNDDCDYVPSHNWLMLFGHHFASIAGAGPIIGPVIAVCFWGWLPALLWVVLGSIFFGGIHDFGSLMVSVREGGVTIGEVAARSISKKAKLILSVFTWLAMMLVITVFAYLGADTFVQQPEVVIPSFGIIPLAIAVGIMLYRLQYRTQPVTMFGLLALGGLIILGKFVPVTFSGQATVDTWLKILLGYCFMASVMPVNFLLQPRDYLSSYLLVGGIVLGLAGVVISRPDMQVPAFTGGGSDIGFLWPMMFITIACGANSGFHSLVASGTTSKQLSTEYHAQRIGYGAMLLEGFLAVLVIVLIGSAFSVTDFNQHIADKTSPVNIYGEAFGNLTAPFLGQWGTFIALTVLNVFILTTLDTATRITRYITTELTGLKNRWLSTGLVVFIAGALAMGKDAENAPLWQKIWPVFGASNQLVAALALLVISCWLLRKDRPTIYALVPAGFMLVTSVTALLWQMVGYLTEGEWLLVLISLILAGAAGVLVKEVKETFERVPREKDNTVKAGQQTGQW